MPGTQTEKTLSRAIVHCFLLVLAVSGLAACQTNTQSKQQFLQFGTLIDVTLITTDQHQATRLFDRIETLLKTRHRQWHGWLDGDLKRFNEALVSDIGAKTPIPDSLLSLIRDSQKYAQITGGLFNPALGKLVAAWGFHQQHQPDHALIERIKDDIPGMHDLIVYGNQAATLNPHLQLDFGAIAKGLAVRQIADLLRADGVHHFIINAGGDIFAAGRKLDRPWRVAIEDPFEPGVIGGLELQSDQGIFTSGNYRRYYDEDRDRRHHIIHPATGEPSPHISSATVIHPDPVLADIAATTLMLTDLSELEAMTRKLGVKHYLVITGQHHVYISQSMQALVSWQDAHQFKFKIL